jgi:hypothetical protein
LRKKEKVSMKKMLFVIVVLGLLLSACTLTLSIDGKEVGSIDPCQVPGVTSKLCDGKVEADDKVVEADDKIVEADDKIVEADDKEVEDPDKGYFPEYSCTDLRSCPVTVVPQGVFVIGFPQGCQTYKTFLAGQEIDFRGLREIHAYNAKQLTLRVTLDSFVDSQKSSILACLP